MEREVGRPPAARSARDWPTSHPAALRGGSLAWRHPALYGLYFSLSPFASRLRSREMQAVLSAADRLASSADRVIDVGCGPGTYTFPIAARCRHVVALDSSPAMLGRLAERVAARGARNVEPRWGRLPDGLGQPEDFDGLVAAGVLDYMPDLRIALSALSAVLRPGGWSVFTVPLPRSAARPAAALEGVILRRAYTRRAEEILNASVAAGLEVRGMEPVGLTGRGRTLVVRALRGRSAASCPRCSELAAPGGARGAGVAAPG